MFSKLNNSCYIQTAMLCRAFDSGAEDVGRGLTNSSFPKRQFVIRNMYQIGSVKFTIRREITGLSSG